MSCAGICSSETRLVPLYQDCVLNQGSAASAIMKHAVVVNKRYHCFQSSTAPLRSPKSYLDEAFGSSVVAVKSKEFVAQKRAPRPKP